MKTFSLQKGFTLLETTLYITLFSLLIGTMLPATFQLLESANRTLTANTIQEEAAFLDRKIAWALSGANDTQSPTPQNLVITRFNAEQLTFSEENNELTLARNNNKPLTLLAKQFKMSDTTFILQQPTNSVTFSFSINRTPFSFKYSLSKNSSFYNLCPK